MKKAELRDRIEALEEALAVTQKLVAEQATERSFRKAWALGPVTGYRVPDPADTAKVGDVLPESWTDFKLNHGCKATARSYHCTRRVHACGQHVATVQRRVVHAWPNDDVIDAAIHWADCPGGECACSDPLPDGWTHTCPRCLAYVEALPPRRICDECETEVGLRSPEWSAVFQKVAERIKAAAAQNARIDSWQRDRTAAIEGAATTLRAHARVFSLLGTHCTCGWLVAPGAALQEHARHVAEQLAAVGALGDTEPVAARPVLIDTEGSEWWPTVGGQYVLLRKGEDDIERRPEIEDQYGPVIERFAS